MLSRRMILKSVQGEARNISHQSLGNFHSTVRSVALWKGSSEKIVDGFPSVVIQVASACARKVLVCDLRIRIGGPRLAGPSVPSIPVLIEYE